MRERAMETGQIGSLRALYSGLVLSGGVGFEWNA